MERSKSVSSEIDDYEDFILNVPKVSQQGEKLLIKDMDVS